MLFYILWRALASQPKLAVYYSSHKICPTLVIAASPAFPGWKVLFVSLIRLILPLILMDRSEGVFAFLPFVSTRQLPHSEGYLLSWALLSEALVCRLNVRNCAYLLRVRLSRASSNSELTVFFYFFYFVPTIRKMKYGRHAQIPLYACKLYTNWISSLKLALLSANVSTYFTIGIGRVPLALGLIYKSDIYFCNVNGVELPSTLLEIPH